MARTNYSFIKYQKELAKKKKREEKQQARLAKKNQQANPDVEPASGDSLGEPKQEA